MGSTAGAAGAAAGGGGACSYCCGGACSWSAQRFACRRETRLLTAVAVPATTAVRPIIRTNGIDSLQSVGFGGFDGVERRDDSLHRDPAAVQQQAARLAHRD